MTNWIQVKTNNHWSPEDKGYYTGGGVGEATYNASQETWTCSDANSLYFFTERGGWVDGLSIKQFRLSFTGAKYIVVSFRQKGASGVSISSNAYVRSGVPIRIDMNPAYGDLEFFLINLTAGIAAVITNIAVSTDDYILDWEDDPGFTDSSFVTKESGKNLDEKPRYAMFRGNPYYCGMHDTPEAVWQGQPQHIGVYKTLVDSEWIGADEAEICQNLAHSVYGHTDADFCVDQNIDYYWHDTDDSRELFVISHGDQYKAIYTIDNTGIVSNWEGSYFPNDRFYYYPENFPTQQENNFLSHKTILDSQNQFWMLYRYTDTGGIPYVTELRVSRFFHLDDARSEHLAFASGGSLPFESCLIYKEAGTEDIEYSYASPMIAIDSEDVVHILYYMRDSGSDPFYWRHVYCKDNTWTGPINTGITGASANISMVTDSSNNLHFFARYGTYGGWQHWVWNGSSWSQLEGDIHHFGTTQTTDFVIDRYDNFHCFAFLGSAGTTYIIRISNEKGYWDFTKVAETTGSDINAKLIYDDSDQSLNFFQQQYVPYPELAIGYIKGYITTSQIGASESSSSVSSESSSSSEESKSSESSVSSTSSESSLSSSSESSSSLSKASKSSSSESSSSSSASKASKSSSSQSSSQSSHSSQSWTPITCSITSGNVAACPHWTWNYGCTTWHGGVWEPCPWPQYDSDSTSYNPYPGHTGGAAWNGTDDEPSGDWTWASAYGEELEFDGTQYTEVELEYARTIVQMDYYGPELYVSRAMSDFDLVASNTGAFSGEEVVLKRVRGLSVAGHKTKYTYTLKNDTAYKYYRIIPWRTQMTYSPTNYHYCRFNRVELKECYDDSSSSSESSSSMSSISESSFSLPSTSSASAGFVGLYQLCNNTNVSSSSSSSSESSYSMQAPDVGWPF